MLAKRVIACLDVRDGVVVKGVEFKNHEKVGEILDLASKYSDQGVDELVFYDISASPEQRRVSRFWVEAVARKINIPFCVAGGIRSLEDAREALASGADKISINSAAIERPQLIAELADEFGQQCVVVGIDSHFSGGRYCVYQYAGKDETRAPTSLETLSWIEQVQDHGAGEIVLNCMNQDGRQQGYDLEQLSQALRICRVPLIASGGAGEIAHFADLFEKVNLSGALAASLFHRRGVTVSEVKADLKSRGVIVR